MVSRFAKPQIGQTSSDFKMGVFKADLKDKLSVAPNPESFRANILRGKIAPITQIIQCE
jgi:hypothetical protein